MSVDRGELSQRCFQEAVPTVQQSLVAIANGDIDFFASRLPASQAWRLYPEFASRLLYLDIETTGMSPHFDEVTMICAFGNGRPSLFVKDINLNEFPDYISQFSVVVTFNGTTFDMPFLRLHFPQALLNQTQIDLRFVFSSLGRKGSLKSIERIMGITRDSSIRDIDGFEAVRLWRRYRLGESAALRQLAFYNLTDVFNLVTLAATAIPLKMQQLTFPGHWNTGDESMATHGFDSATISNWLDVCWPLISQERCRLPSELGH